MLACYFVTRPPTTPCRLLGCPLEWLPCVTPVLHLAHGSPTTTLPAYFSPWGYLQLGEPLSASRDLLCPLPESLHLKPANKTCTKLSGAKLKWPRKASLNVSSPAREDAGATHMHDPSSKEQMSKSEFRSQALATS